MSGEPKPKVSVIMSVFNGMPYLKESARSILNQTYSNLEFIIVDDASNDESLSFLKSLKDPRISLIINKKNLGLAASLNLALKKATGAYIARMDADDISTPSRLQNQLHFLKTNKGIDLCGTWATIIDKKNKKIGVLKYPTSPADIKNKLIQSNPIIHPSMMARKSFFYALNGYREDYDGAEDYDLLMRGKNKFTYANLPEELLQLRLSSTRRSVKSISKMDMLDLKIKINSIKKDGLSALAALAVLRKLFFMFLLPTRLKLKVARALNRA